MPVHEVSILRILSGLLALGECLAGDKAAIIVDATCNGTAYGTRHQPRPEERDSRVGSSIERTNPAGSRDDEQGQLN
jgi:hypothetical protein